MGVVFIVGKNSTVITFFYIFIDVCISLFYCFPMPKETRPKSTHSHIPLRVPASLKLEIHNTAKEVELSEQETMRQALRRGLPLLKQIMASAAA